MFKRTFLFFAAILLGVSAQVRAADHTGRLGLNYTVGPSFIVGGDGATDVSSVQPGVGAGLQLGLSPNLDARFDYDYIDADLRTQALTFGAQWGFMPNGAVNPFVGAGLGFGKPYSGEGWDHFSMKLNGGVEKELTSNISLAALLGYQFVDGSEPFGSVHTIEPGIRLTYFFGSFSR
jgi:opacity protein-like surface antigen